MHRGQKLTRVLLGEWEPSKGTEIRGIAGGTWHYATCYLQTDSGEVYALEQRSLERSALPKDAADWPEIAPHLPATIEDVLADRYGEVRVILANRMYLENAALPGGSRLILGELSEWSDEELKEPQTSLIDGRRLPLGGIRASLHGSP